MVNTKIRLILFFIAIHEEALYSQHKKQTNKQKTPGVDCGSDHQLFSAKFRLKLKKVEETTRPLRYDINQMAYDSIVEVTSRFKVLDLAHRGPGELWAEIHNVQEALTNHPKEKEMQEDKVVF